MNKFALVVLAILFAAGDAVACSCVMLTSGDPVKDAVSAAGDEEVVFLGRVVAVAVVIVDDEGAIVFENAPQPKTGSVLRLAVFRVEEMYKGTVAPLATIITGGGGGDCGYSFEEGKEYIVFAGKATEKRELGLVGSTQALTTSICSYTQRADNALELRKALTKELGARKVLPLKW